MYPHYFNLRINSLICNTIQRHSNEGEKNEDEESASLERGGVKLRFKDTLRVVDEQSFSQSTAISMHVPHESFPSFQDIPTFQMR